MNSKDWLSYGSGTVFLALGLLTMQCTPDPKRQACRIDSDCPDAERGRAYCAQHRCVECVTRASCGPHMACVKGACVPDS